MIQRDTRKSAQWVEMAFLVHSFDAENRRELIGGSVYRLVCGTSHPREQGEALPQAVYHHYGFVELIRRISAFDAEPNEPENESDPTVLES